MMRFHEWGGMGGYISNGPGEARIRFLQSGDNPVLNSAATEIGYPDIVEQDANTWAMVYTELDTVPGADVHYATAPKTDPHNWTKAVADNPILVPAAGNYIWSVAVLHDGSTFYVLYDTVGQFALASGNALNALVKYSAVDAPVFSGQGVGWEQFVRHPALIKVGGIYHLFYDGRQGGVWSGIGAIGHATSPDMINWTRDVSNPILSPVGVEFEAGDVGAPSVAVVDGEYWMAYAGFHWPEVLPAGSYPHWIGLATSDAVGGPYLRYGQNPVLSPGPPADWDGEQVAGAILFPESTNLHMYFRGKDTGGVAALGYATML